MPQITKRRIGEYLQTAFKIVQENGGSYPSREIVVEMEKKMDFSDYEKQRYEKTGYIRWQSFLHFYSIDCSKAGWIKKNKGVWYITAEGEKALDMDPEEYIRSAMKKYRQWKREVDSKESETQESENEEIVEENRTTAYDQALESARKEIEEFIHNLNAYEFQDLVAGLLRGMGYYTPFVAPQGPDGGIDIIAYKDPLGAEGARIKVQVKHRKDIKVTRQEISSLNGVLKVGEVGLVVSSGGFTKDALNEMRSVNNHMEKMDLDDFVGLWETYYEKLAEEDKSLLPIRRISFLAPVG